MEEFTQVLAEGRMEELMVVFMEVFLGRRAVEGWLLVGVMERHLEEDMDIYERLQEKSSGSVAWVKAFTRSICSDAMR